jgi:hypothetical protein
MKERATEIVAIGLPVLLEAVAVVFTIAIAALWTGIASGRI